jgi:kynureninase
LQQLFLNAVQEGRIGPLRSARLVSPVGTPRRGHFLTFETPRAATLYEELLERRIVTDVRGHRIRFGFGCYHTAEAVEEAVERIRAAVPA